MAEGCQVDFYVLSGNGPTVEQMACRLALMAWEQGLTVGVLAGSEEDTAALDRFMWEYPPGRFLPHAAGEASQGTPVLIDTRIEGRLDGRNLIINLSDKPVPEPGRFSRLLEIVPGSDEQRKASRAKYARYRELGLTPQHHEIGS
jgi:DNA polymerase-3 subunit chi